MNFTMVKNSQFTRKREQLKKNSEFSKISANSMNANVPFYSSSKCYIFKIYSIPPPQKKGELKIKSSGDRTFKMK